MHCVTCVGMIKTQHARRRFRRKRALNFKKIKNKSLLQYFSSIMRMQRSCEFLIHLHQLPVQLIWRHIIVFRNERELVFYMQIFLKIHHLPEKLLNVIVGASHYYWKFSFWLASLYLQSQTTTFHVHRKKSIYTIFVFRVAYLYQGNSLLDVISWVVRHFRSISVADEMMWNVFHFVYSCFVCNNIKTFVDLNSD